MMAQPGFEQETFETRLRDYLAQVNKGDALQKVRGKAWDHFLELGLPSRQQEAFRYIKLRQLFAQTYQLAEEETLSADEIHPFIYPECQDSVLIFVNGHYSTKLSRIEALPKNVVISSLLDAMQPYGAFLNNQWAKSIKEEIDPFVVLNSALHRNGAFIYLPPHTEIESPLQILHLIKVENQPLILLPRLTIFVGAQSQLNIAFSQHSLGHQNYFVNQAVDLVLEEQAHVHYNQILSHEGDTSWHFDALRANLKKHSTLKTVCVTEGSATVRTDYRVALNGENSEAFLNGVWMLSEKREAHTHVWMEHQAPNCRSYQLYKGVLNDVSRSSFEGKILVRQVAQKTEAFQLNNNLLLKDGAHADSKPNLEIFADDVKASHGATIGQLDTEQLFYMKTRGIQEDKAKNLLVYGFCEQVIDLINIPSVKSLISQRAQRYLIKDSHVS
jgi:Fe-S cluster assembly protein SufD